MSQFVSNRYVGISADSYSQYSDIFENRDRLIVHKSLPEYKPTPLVSLPALAEKLGVVRLLVKDESYRFGLKAFKALGASYAIYKVVSDYLKVTRQKEFTAERFYQSSPILPGSFTFCTATDGNHGRAVAWTAAKLRQKAVIYMPGNSVPARVKNIENEGAKVILIDGGYDDAVMAAKSDAEANGWQVISDTSWPGYDEIPKYIMAGYLTMFEEIDNTLEGEHKPDVVFIQGGVGAFAASAAWYHKLRNPGSGTKLISIEPTNAACMMHSILSEQGEPITIPIAENTIMAGLNCGTPSPVSWPLIKAGYDYFMAIPDEASIEAMRQYYNPINSDPRIISGESGAAGLGALLQLCLPENKRYFNLVGLNSHSTVLIINTEGDTDPESFDRLVRQVQ